jgi:hypothetical protein
MVQSWNKFCFEGDMLEVLLTGQVLGWGRGLTMARVRALAPGRPFHCSHTPTVGSNLLALCYPLFKRSDIAKAFGFRSKLPKLMTCWYMKSFFALSIDVLVCGSLMGLELSTIM